MRHRDQISPSRVDHLVVFFECNWGEEDKSILIQNSNTSENEIPFKYFNERTNNNSL